MLYIHRIITQQYVGFNSTRIKWISFVQIRHNDEFGIGKRDYIFLASSINWEKQSIA